MVTVDLRQDAKVFGALSIFQYLVFSSPLNWGTTEHPQEYPLQNGYGQWFLEGDFVSDALGES